MTAEITVLSAGAVQPGLVKVIDAFRCETGDEVKVTFATAPSIRKRLSSGEIAHVLIAPPELLDQLEKAAPNKPLDRNVVGRIGVGVAVRDSSPMPKIATVDEFKKSLLSAESIAYNQASTGIYLESLFERLGVSAQLKSKTTRYADFAAVRDHVARGTVNEIGLGATTVIIESAGKGLKFVGPLPGGNSKLYDLRRDSHGGYASQKRGRRATSISQQSEGEEDVCSSRHRMISSPLKKSPLSLFSKEG
jgi:molybdate transport system substrate-binding protein